MREKMGFDKIFDRLYISCELGCHKPNAAYYEHVQKSLALDGKSLLFWDDSYKNVAAARSFGWNAEQYTDFESFIEKLGTYKICISDPGVLY